MPRPDQSLSPETRLGNVHSRNSSKTLKCPKCECRSTKISVVDRCVTIEIGNWHYKYQETLEIHMKEKHQVNTSFDGQLSSLNDVESPCGYCLSNNVHPRLARGEQYPCGFKPYRCDLCLYSTTTKGNLAIHMQSDKHMNNCKDLSSASIQQLCTSLASPDNSISDVTSLASGMSHR